MMKRLIFWLQLFFSFFLMSFQGAAHAENYIEVLKNGTVDWTNRFVDAAGVGRPPSDPLNAAHSRALAQRNADLAARSNLIEVVKSIRVDSSTRVGDNLEGKGISALGKLFRAAREVDLSYGQEGEVKVTVSAGLDRALVDLILPESILTISTVKQPREPERNEHQFTGLIVDCRGISLQPALVPLIADEDGEIVYGPAFASRDHATANGMVSYMRNFDSAKNHPRVGPRPIAVKGIRTPKGKPCDIMISHADAAKIRSLASNLGFLHQCRVILVAD